MLGALLNLLLGFLALTGPLAVGIFTPRLYGFVKGQVAVSKWLDKLPGWAQQFAVLATAFLLYKLGAFLNGFIPITFFAGGDVAALIAAGIAFALHVEDKVKILGVKVK